MRHSATALLGLGLVLPRYLGFRIEFLPRSGALPSCGLVLRRYLVPVFLQLNCLFRFFAFFRTGDCLLFLRPLQRVSSCLWMWPFIIALFASCLLLVVVASAAWRSLGRFFDCSSRTAPSLIAQTLVVLLIILPLSSVLRTVSGI